MSNLKDLLTDIFADNATATAKAGDIIGTLADLSGAVGFIQLGIGAIESFFTQDDELQSVLTAIETAFGQLQGQIAATDKLQRMRDIDQGITPAAAVFQQLPAIVGTNPPPSTDFKLTQIQTCIDAVIFFTDFDDKWKVVQADMPYYSDSWSGSLAPAAGDDGLVFNYTYTLPQFLRSIYFFLTTVAALEPGSLNLYTNLLQKCIVRLQTVHQTIVSTGIVAAKFPAMEDIGDIAESSALPYGGGIPPFSINWVLNSGARNPTFFPYGAIEIYSGASDVGSYMTDHFDYWGSDLSTWGPPQPNNFITLLNFWIARKKKSLYVQLGMPAVWQVIDQLLSLTGQPPQSSPPYSAWSFAEVISILGLTLQPSRRWPPLPPAWFQEPVGFEAAVKAFLLATPPYQAFRVLASDTTDPTFDPASFTVSVPPVPLPSGSLFTALTGVPLTPPLELMPSTNL
jgi:hypothetical protein